MKSRRPLQDTRRDPSQAVTSSAETIAARGREKVVAPTVEDDKHLASPPVPLSEFFRQSPLYGIDLDLERSPDTGRDSAP
jgi:hypothetical protein